jgi:hypothetical protein
MRGGADKRLVLELYPRAVCSRFPIVHTTSLPTRFFVKLEPGSPRFASGNTAAQAWRRAYEKILESRRGARRGKNDN